MRRIIALSAVSVLALTGLTGCGIGGGPRVSETRDVTGATSVFLDGSATLTITRGEPSLTITAAEPLMSRLTSEVRDGELRLDRRSGFFVFDWGYGDVEYELSLPSLTGLELDGSADVVTDVADGDFDASLDGSGSLEIRNPRAGAIEVSVDGSGDIVVTGIEADSVEASIDGAGTIGLSGRTTALDLAIDGAGSINADELEARDAEASIDGAGDIRLWVTKTLGAVIDGAGSIRHRGGASIVENRIDGVGSVIAE